MNFIIFTLLLVGTVNKVFCENDTDNAITSKVSESSRQKRLLFYDEEGNLVKTYTNPYLRDVVLSPEKQTVFGNFLNPFLGFFRPSTFNSPIHYMIPVSSEVVQQINADPTLQNKLVLLPAKEANVEANPLCSGKRNQIPSPQTCNTFLNCWDGWAFEQECPTGLLFSNLGYCDYPHNVNCYDRRVKEIAQPKCIKEYEVYRNQDQCNEFFVCVNQQPIKFTCPADLAYNQELGVCDYPQRVNCINTLGTTPSSPLPALPSTGTMPTQPSVYPSEKQPDDIVVSNADLQKLPPIQTIVTKSDYNSERWSSTQVAISRQDAIRQLKLRELAKVNTNY